MKAQGRRNMQSSKSSPWEIFSLAKAVKGTESLSCRNRDKDIYLKTSIIGVHNDRAQPRKLFWMDSLRAMQCANLSIKIAGSVV